MTSLGVNAEKSLDTAESDTPIGPKILDQVIELFHQRGIGTDGPVIDFFSVVSVNGQPAKGAIMITDDEVVATTELWRHMVAFRLCDPDCFEACAQFMLDHAAVTNPAKISADKAQT